MADGRLDRVATAEVLADRLRFSRGLHNDECAALCRSGVGFVYLDLSLHLLLARLPRLFHSFFVISHLSTSVQPVDGSHLYHPAPVCASFTTSAATFSALLASVSTVASALA